MIASLMISGLAALLLAPALPQQDEGPYGIYTYVKGMLGDQEIPKENLDGSKVEIEEGEIELIGPDGTEQFEIKYTIDEEGADHVKFSMEIVESKIMPDAVGSKAKGLAKHEGDLITLIYDYAEGADYPDDFEPEAATEHLFVLKKSAEKDDDDDDKEDDDDGEDDPR